MEGDHLAARSTTNGKVATEESAVSSACARHRQGARGMRRAWSGPPLNGRAWRESLGSIDNALWPEDSFDGLEDARTSNEALEYNLMCDPLSLIEDDLDRWLERPAQEHDVWISGDGLAAMPAEVKGSTSMGFAREAFSEGRRGPTQLAFAMAPHRLDGSGMSPGGAPCAAVPSAGLLCPATEAWMSASGCGVTPGSEAAALPMASSVPVCACGQPMLAPSPISACAESPTQLMEAHMLIQRSASCGSLPMSSRRAGKKLPPKEYKRHCQEYRCKRCGAPKKGHVCSAPRDEDFGFLRKEWTQREDDFILMSVAKYGGRWRAIASVLPERTDDAVRARVVCHRLHTPQHSGWQ
uniref:Myb-like domain-containing protein n=1 Tax=Calcidiscus leptoporus TaxID=127549 RepID=A0A7S0J135_9EUKA|mmetsp:Transcript_33529/g.78461  ORF Transcript_33529/g.78461 Transcript_33529/m.78461 type:complete len:353 (+) Transcript_33529:33-1091(+)